MKLAKISIYWAYLFSATSSVAEPCVSRTFDKPFPNAVDVVYHTTDIPSVAFPSYWQEGTISGFEYTLFPTGEADLSDGINPPNWTIELNCSSDPENCETTTFGVPPLEAVPISQQMGRCLLGKELSDPTPHVDPTELRHTDALKSDDIEPTPAAGVQTSSSEVETQSPDLETPLAEIVSPPSKDTKTPTKEKCGLALLPKGGPEITLQRLLVLAGENPGEPDGIIGPKTLGALRAIFETADLAVENAIERLARQICERK